VEKSFKAVKIYSGDVYVYVGSAVNKSNALLLFNEQ